MDNPASREHNSKSTIGPRSTGGMASERTTGATASLGTEKPKAFDAQGAIGKQFTTEGTIGGTAQKVGGPLAEDGVIGKQFTKDGSIGGTVQNAMGGTKQSHN